MLWVLAPIGAAALAAIARGRHARSIERGYSERYGHNAQGIAAGAEPFTLEGMSGRALLLLHGSGDSPQSLAYLAARLHSAGYTVHVPLLPGHGRSPRAFSRATAADYHEAARAAFARLKEEHEWVGLIGQSMGGALATRLAAEVAGARVLVLLAPYLIAPAEVRRVARLSWLLRIVAPYVQGGGEASIHDPAAAAASRGYGSFSGGALKALVATADAGFKSLARLSIPTIVINSDQDNRIPRATAEAALSAMPESTEQHWVTGCGHVISVDYCKARVADLVLAFVARYAD